MTMVSDPSLSGASTHLGVAFLIRHSFGYTRIMNQKGNRGFLERVFKPVSSSLNEEAARKLIGLKADRKAQARIAKLADKCNEGELSPAERREYEMYIIAGQVVGVLQAQARLLLAR
jgi:hypothetical protein